MGCVPSKDEFRELARRARVVPVYREIIADTDTPVTALAKLGLKAPVFLLESVEGGERLGRYSFLGSGARAVLEARGRRVTIRHRDGRVERTDEQDGLEALEALLDRFQPAPIPGLPPFYGGAVGYVGFDGLAPRPGPARGEEEPPDLLFLITDGVLVFDHVARKMQIVVHAEPEGDPDGAYDRAAARIDAIVERLQGRARLRPLAGPGAGSAESPLPRPSPPEFRTHGTPSRFFQAAAKARERVQRGDVYQVVLSLKLSAPLRADPFNVYRVLRSVNPSPYMFYFNFGRLQLVGSSPEVMVRLQDGEAVLRPIAGTRRRGATSAEDEARAKELLSDEKERAEHVMLVDLSRGDLGRVCRTDTVRVDRWMEVEKYSHVMHIVSNVRGELRPDRTAFDLLRATFPAGTVSGAPKARALEMIAELEETPRGPYGGAVGYFGFGGNMDSCIAIRTVVIHGGEVHVQAGAGIVADSNPESEYEEIHDKARALLQAVAWAEEASR